MTYQETIDYLYNQLPVYQQIGGAAYKEGLDNSLALDKYFNHPHAKYKTIHVGGTNGKGSISHTSAAILQQSGYKVGLFTSPHLLDFKERIRVNGEKISEQYVVDFVEKHKSSFEPIQPSFFELTMMMAFLYFAEMEVDIAIIEVGLGGRLDSTNIITPILSIITNISIDHTQYLGDSIEKIAGEKAGIIKKGIPVIIGETNDVTRKVFSKVSNEVSAPITFAKDNNLIKSYHKSPKGWMYDTDKYPQLMGELGGYAQVKNANTLLNCIIKLEEQKIGIPKSAVYKGFDSVVELTGLMGRWQIIQEKSPKIVCDTGHNVGGIQYVAEQLKNEQYEKLRIVIGMVNDKDINNVLSLLPKDAIYYFTKAAIPRALSVEELTAKSSSHGLEGRGYQSVNEALKESAKEAGERDLIFVGGSNFVVAEALEYLGYK